MNVSRLGDTATVVLLTMLLSGGCESRPSETEADLGVAGAPEIEPAIEPRFVVSTSRHVGSVRFSLGQLGDSLSVHLDTESELGQTAETFYIRLRTWAVLDRLTGSTRLKLSEVLPVARVIDSLDRAEAALSSIDDFVQVDVQPTGSLGISRFVDNRGRIRWSLQLSDQLVADPTTTQMRRLRALLLTADSLATGGSTP